MNGSAVSSSHSSTPAPSDLHVPIRFREKQPLCTPDVDGGFPLFEGVSPLSPEFLNRPISEVEILRLNYPPRNEK